MQRSYRVMCGMTRSRRMPKRGENGQKNVLRDILLEIDHVGLAVDIGINFHVISLKRLVRRSPLPPHDPPDQFFVRSHILTALQKYIRN